MFVMFIECGSVFDENRISHSGPGNDERSVDCEL